MAVIQVDIAGRPYQVHVGSDLLQQIGSLCGTRLRKKRVPIITDTNVHAAWGKTIEDSLSAIDHQVAWHILPAGETTKSWKYFEQLIDWLLEMEVERGDHIIALGGGVIGDLTGFAASIVKRGCHFIQLPTSLLAQVDSSVGGKTAINTSAGKNLVGAFHQPSLVLADLSALETLSPRELRAGYAEVIKYGLLGDAPFFAWCEKNGAAMLAGDRALREYAVAHSVAAKAQVVAADEFEKTGTRALLNLGHTFGHALEAETGFSERLLHGEGVALGMVLAAYYSARLGLISQSDAERIQAHIASVDLPSDIKSLGLTCSGQTLVQHMLHDKKMDAGTLPFLLMKNIGEAFLSKDADLDDVARFLDEQLSAE